MIVNFISAQVCIKHTQLQLTWKETRAHKVGFGPPGDQTKERLPARQQSSYSRLIFKKMTTEIMRIIWFINELCRIYDSSMGY